MTNKKAHSAYERRPTEKISNLTGFYPLLFVNSVLNTSLRNIECGAFEASLEFVVAAF